MIYVLKEIVNNSNSQWKIWIDDEEHGVWEKMWMVTVVYSSATHSMYPELYKCNSRELTFVEFLKFDVKHCTTIVSEILTFGLGQIFHLLFFIALIKNLFVCFHQIVVTFNYNLD